MKSCLSFSIDTEVSAERMPDLLEYLKTCMTKPEMVLAAPMFTLNGDPVLGFTVQVFPPQPALYAELVGKNPMTLKITVLDEQYAKLALSFKRNILLRTRSYEERTRAATLNLVWNEGKDGSARLAIETKKPMHQSLIELQITMVIGFMSLGLALYLIFGLWIAPAIIILAQFGFVFYSNKIFARMGGLRITGDNPIVRLIQCRLPIDASDKAYAKYPPKVLNAIKERVYAKTAEMGISCENVRKILVSTKIKCQAQDVTIGCRPQDVTMKEIDVYRLVKQTADNFHFPVPKIMVTNTSAPNAAAAGSSPKRGVVLITTGALERLSDEEMLSVLGHEFGHLRGRDPLLIFGFSAFEFLTRCYIILPAIAGPMQIPLIMTYMWAAVSLTAFIGKFLEARADLVSAIMTGKPQALANALKKIGAPKLALEESTSFRAHEWINLDPHPPLYFRVQRMECLETPIKTKHTLIRSVRDVLAGFVKSTKCQ